VNDLLTVAPTKTATFTSNLEGGQYLGLTTNSEIWYTSNFGAITFYTPAIAANGTITQVQ
jgi:hypothetical protein